MKSGLLRSVIVANETADASASNRSYLISAARLAGRGYLRVADPSVNRPKFFMRSGRYGVIGRVGVITKAALAALTVRNDR